MHFRKKGGDRMLTCQHAQELFSEYFDNTLDPERHHDVGAHLDRCAACHEEYLRFAQQVVFIHNAQDPEPVLDLWQEFLPKMAAWEEEQKLALWPRLRQQWHHAMAHIAEGAILYTSVLAHRTTERMERYLIRDPFVVSD